jgi:prepilin-type N-terminal cleavage/methylation domain-containing protein
MRRKVQRPVTVRPMRHAKLYKKKMQLTPQTTDCSGFTLIEMMVAIGVGMLLMAIAIPNFTSVLPRLRLNDAARQVATELAQVRMKAIAQSIPFQINFAPTSYVIQRCNGACADFGGTMALPQGITITPPPTAPQFQSRGNIAGAATVSIQLDGGGANIWVCVMIVGRINIQGAACT